MPKIGSKRVKTKTHQKDNEELSPDIPRCKIFIKIKH